MTQSYSLDLRVRVVAFVEAGHSCRAAARPTAATMALAVITPTPGMPIRRRQPASWPARAAMSRVRTAMRSSSCRQSSANGIVRLKR